MKSDNNIGNKYLYEFNIGIIYLIISILYLSIIFLSDNFVINDTLYYVSLENKLSITNIESLINNVRKFKLISYILTPLILYIKWVLITLIIFVSIKFYEVEISFRNCFKIVIISEFASLLSSIFKLLYFYIYPPSNLEEVQNFIPLGFTTFIKFDNIPVYLKFLLQQLNIFEIFYWFLLVFGLMSIAKLKFNNSLIIISSSYGISQAIWCILIIFIQLQFA